MNLLSVGSVAFDAIETPFGKTGKIIGGVFNNKGDYQHKVVGKSITKVFSFADKRGVAEYVSIETHQNGKNASFVGIDYLQTVVTGTCD